MHIYKIADKLSLSCITDYFSVPILILVATVSSTAIADDYPSWSVKGFGTIGFARSDNDTIGFYRDRTQTQEVKKSLEISTDSRLGLQLDVDINEFLHITTQFVVRDHAGDFVEQNLDWAFLKWNPGNGYEIRAGRVGADGFLLSDYRNVAYSYPWVRPPHEFYANIPVTHLDGIDIKKTLFLENGELSFKISAGHSSTTMSEEFLDFDLEGPTGGLTIVYNTGDWQFRAAYYHIWQKEEINKSNIAGLTSALKDPTNNFLVPNLNKLMSKSKVKNSHLQFMSLGTAYDDGTWIVHAEASYLDEENQPLISDDTASAYLSIGRRISDVTLYSRYGIVKSFHKKLKPLDINPLLVGSPFEAPARGLSQGISTIFDEQEISQQSVSIGLRWDFYQKIAFKAEWSHIWIDGDGSGLWQADIRDTTPNHVNLLSFGFDFIF